MPVQCFTGVFLYRSFEPDNYFVCTGSHRIVRLRAVAPSAAVNQSTSDSISAHWPGRSVARSTAAAHKAGSGPVELPVNRPDNEAKQVRLTQQRGPVQYYGDNFIGLNDQPPHILKVLHVRDAQTLCKADVQ